MGCNDSTFTIRAGDTLPQLLLHLHEEGGDAPDFTGASANLQVEDAAGETVIDRAGTLYTSDQEDPLSGEPYNFLFAWQAGETDLDPGTYRAEVEVTFAGGGVATFPSDPRENVRIKIRRAIA